MDITHINTEYIKIFSKDGDMPTNQPFEFLVQFNTETEKDITNNNHYQGFILNSLLAWLEEHEYFDDYDDMNVIFKSDYHSSDGSIFKYMCSLTITELIN